MNIEETKLHKIDNIIDVVLSAETSDMSMTITKNILSETDSDSE